MRAMRFLVCAASTVMAGACVSPEVDAGVGIAYYTPADDEDPCLPNGCGGNSPVMDGVYFWRLHVATLPGLPTPPTPPSTGTVQITGVHKNGTAMRLQVVNGDELFAVHPVTGAVIAQGTSLPGTRIDVSVNGQPYEIVIEWAAPSESFWVGAGLPIWRYRFKYRPLFGGGERKLRPLCSEGDNDPTQLDALVFEGDLYDPATKAITIGPATAGWMNIACAGSAIYKMHTVGHTSAAQARLGFATTINQRRAMLNAWTSNVCGTGEAFTHQGEPITLRESLGVFNMAPYNAVPQSREAIWDENGAVCLNVHRLEEDDPEIYDKIAAACPGGVLPPSCAGMFLDWTTHGHVRTGNL